MQLNQHDVIEQLHLRNACYPFKGKSIVEGHSEEAYPCPLAVAARVAKETVMMATMASLRALPHPCNRHQCTRD